MKTKKLIRFIEEPVKLDVLDMNQIRGGLNKSSDDCGVFSCGAYARTKDQLSAI